MYIYIFKRLLAMIPTLLGITLITFFIINLAPGDPVATQFGQGGSELSAEGSGSGGKLKEQERMQDAIKAKKKLLGMMEEDYTLYAWNAAASPAAGEGFAALEPITKTAPLPTWALTFISDSDGSIYAGTGEGEVFKVEGGESISSVGDHWHGKGMAELAWSPD